MTTDAEVAVVHSDLRIRVRCIWSSGACRAIDGRIVEYIKEHPQGTTGDMAKGLNANRGTSAAEVSHMMRAGALTKGPGPHTLSATE